MTKEEFDKIESLKYEISNLERILYGGWLDSENPLIYRLKVSFTNDDYFDAPISKELSNAILKVIESRLEKFKEEFEKFKTE